MSQKHDLNLFLFLSLNMVLGSVASGGLRWSMRRGAKAGLKSSASIASKSLPNLTVKVAGSRLGLGAGALLGAGGLVVISEFFTNFDPLPDIPILTPFLDQLKDLLNLDALSTTMFVIILFVIIACVIWIVTKFRGGK